MIKATAIMCSGRFPKPIDKIEGVKYVAEFINAEEDKVSLTWYTRSKDTWKFILDAVRKLPTREYNPVKKTWVIPWNVLTQNWALASGWPSPTSFTELPPEESPLIKQKQIIENTKLDPEGVLIPGLRSYQIDFLKFAQHRRGRVILGDEMGCVDYSMVVHVTHHGKPLQLRFSDLFDAYVEDPTGWYAECGKDSSVTTYGEIIDVTFSGHKMCKHVTLYNGVYVVLTADHEIRTPTGYVQAKDSVGMEVLYVRDGVLKASKVKSVTNAGLRPTYDMKVLNYNNFTANRIVVHNCGKTVEALSWMTYANAYPALYVVTATTKLQWEAAYRKWVGSTNKPYPDVQVLYGQTPKPLSKDKSYVINWEILTYWEDSLSNVGFRLIVGDEIQAIGNPDSKMSKAFVKLAKEVPHVIGMSGTPILSGPRQFWPLLNTVEPQVFKNKWSYLNRYCGPETNEYGTTYKGSSNESELHTLLVDCMLRRTKQEVMKELPPKVIEVVPLEVDAKELSAYMDEEAAAFSSTVRTREDNPRSRVAQLLHTTYLLKEKAILAWVDEFLSSGKKLLLFAWHRSVVELLYDSLRQWSPVKVYGGISANEKNSAVNTFINNPACRLFIANIQAGGIGIDGLQQAASDVAFVEFAHTPLLHNQAEDRLCRMGQKDSVTSYYFVAPNTIDMDAIEVLDGRSAMFGGIMDGKAAADIDLLSVILERRGCTAV